MSRRGSALVGSILLVAAIGLGLAARAHPGPWPVDERWADLVVGMRAPGPTFVAERVFDPLGRFPLSWAIVAIAAVALWRSGRPRATAVLLIGEVASWAANNLIKVIVDRPRPAGGLIQASGSSYPSGHAAFAAVTAVLLVASLVPPGRRVGWGVAGSVLVLGMAWSRTYLMVHWLTDVLGGLAVGSGVALLALACLGAQDARRWPERRR